MKDIEMKKAEYINDIPNAFDADPLTVDQLNFYKDTMPIRTGDKSSSPIDNIYVDCITPSQRNSFLFLGHKGCGKSTELNALRKRFEEDGYYVHTVSCSTELDLMNPLYADLLILFGDALLSIAKDSGVKLDRQSVSTIMSFWSKEATIFSTENTSESTDVTGEFKAESPKILEKLLSIYVGVKADLKFSEEKRKEYRERMAVRSSEWLLTMNNVASQITDHVGYQPIVIFEDLDKLNPDDAWKVFYNYAAVLSGVTFPVIYTFPISLAYMPKFGSLEGFFKIYILPMIKLETSDGHPYEDGYNCIHDIIEKRASLSLFDDEALRKAIIKTGGSLRDLFGIIRTASRRAARRKSKIIEGEDVDRALIELKSSLTRRIERKNYKFLAEIYYKSKATIEDTEMLLEMMQANVVLEYNGTRWHNVHPLVADFLEEIGGRNLLNDRE